MFERRGVWTYFGVDLSEDLVKHQKADSGSDEGIKPSSAAFRKRPFFPPQPEGAS